MSFGNICHGEALGRRTIAADPLLNTKYVFRLLRGEAAAARSRRQHYEGYGYGASALLRTAAGDLKIISGGSYKPYRGDAKRRVCAEIATYSEPNIKPNEKVSAVLFIESPPKNELRVVEGQTRVPDSGWSCDKCANYILSMVSPDIHIATFFPGSNLPSELLTPGDMLQFYNDEGSPYPTRRPKKELLGDIYDLMRVEVIPIQPPAPKLSGIAPAQVLKLAI